MKEKILKTPVNIIVYRKQNNGTICLVDTQKKEHFRLYK